VVPSVLLLHAGDVAPVRLVGFHDATGTTKHRECRVIAHGLAQPHRHEPSGLVGHADHAVDLVAADALLGSVHQIGDLKPQVQLDVRPLEDVPTVTVKGLRQSFALVETLAVL